MLQETMEVQELVEPEVFNEKVEQYRQQNKLLNQLLNNLGSWENLPAHLQQDLFKKVNCKPRINKY
jgi:hypothetical protein